MGVKGLSISGLKCICLFGGKKVPYTLPYSSFIVWLLFSLRYFDYVQKHHPEKAEEARESLQNHLKHINNLVNESMVLLYKLPDIARKFHLELPDWIPKPPVLVSMRAAIKCCHKFFFDLKESKSVYLKQVVKLMSDKGIGISPFLKFYNLALSNKI